MPTLRPSSTGRSGPSAIRASTWAGSWSNADPATYRRTTRYAGALPSTRELGGIYTEAVGRPVPDVAWFEALACFKSTATWALIVKHNRRRTAPEPAHEEMAAALPHLLERASTLLG